MLPGHSLLTAALKKRDNHLNLLFPDLVVFALFDQQVPTVERQAMASHFLSWLELWEPFAGGVMYLHGQVFYIYVIYVI